MHYTFVRQEASHEIGKIYTHEISHFTVIILGSQCVLFIVLGLLVSVLGILFW